MLRKADHVPRWAVILGIAAIGLSFVLVFSPVVKDIWCDGAYEAWRVPDDYNGEGCAELLPAWHAIFPWNQHDTEMICFGYCLDARPWYPDEPVPYGSRLGAMRDSDPNAPRR